MATLSYLVTGCAGFIGAAVTVALLEKGHNVLGIDNLNNYYSVKLKKSRLDRCKAFKNFHFLQIDITDKTALKKIEKQHFDRLIHLAAQAGVRHSIECPQDFITANLLGFGDILELVRNNHVAHLIYASSSSVYGGNEKQPFEEQDAVTTPISLYAATKRANELMAHTYAHLYGIPCTGLRFFTVYGPWGRPDMALFRFTEKILKGETIDVYNHGDMLRDFTYIDDVVRAVLALSDLPPEPHDSFTDSTTNAPFALYNVGNQSPMPLMDFIEAIEHAAGKKAIKNYMPLQAGDVPKTHANSEKLFRRTGFQPNTPIEVGVQAFVDWYREYYRVHS